MPPQDTHRCTREKEIDRLLQDCDTIKQRENILEIMINGLKNQMDAFIESINTKIDSFIKKFDEKATEDENNFKSFEARLSKLEKVLFSLKWLAIGALLITALTHSSSISGFILDLLKVL